MVRGIERRAIFLDDEDRAWFLFRLARVLGETGTRCFAFALMSNHYHLLLRTGATPLTRVMRRLGTGHAMDFNRRHRRVGYLYQNRFKSKLVKDDSGLITLVRYIHLNPVKARMVPDLDALATYPWTGHAALMGLRRAPFLDAATVLSCFGETTRKARRELLRWMAAVGDEDPEETVADPGEEVPATDAAAGAEDPPPDALTVLEIRRRRWAADGWDASRVLVEVCARLDVDPDCVRRGRRSRSAVRARVAVAGVAILGLGLTHTSVARATGTTRQAVGQALARFEAAREFERTDALRVLPAPPL
jgi:REP element-mobilizing transposase RayT